MTMNMFVDIWILELSGDMQVTNLNKYKYFITILNSFIQPYLRNTKK